MISLRNRKLNDCGKMLGHHKPDNSFPSRVPFLLLLFLFFFFQGYSGATAFLPFVFSAVNFFLLATICSISYDHLLLLLQKALFCLILTDFQTDFAAF